MPYKFGDGEGSTMKKYRIRQPKESFGKSDTMPWGNRNYNVKKWNPSTQTRTQYTHRHGIKRTIYSPTQPPNKEQRVVYVDLSTKQKSKSSATSSILCNLMSKNVKYTCNTGGKTPPNFNMRESNTQCGIVPPRIAVKIDSLSSRIDALLDILERRKDKRVKVLKNS